MAATSTPSLTVLGAFALRVGGHEITGLPRKAQALIAFLAMQPDRRMPREIVADLLWTYSGPEQARHSLRQMLVVLRRTPVRDLVRTDADTLWIESGAIAVDALVLEASITAPDQASLSQGVALYSGALLEDLPAVSPRFHEWLLPERARLAGIMSQALRRLAGLRIAAGDFAAASETAAHLVRLDALDEAAHRLLMECLARAGRRSEALQQFESCARTLKAELDIAPDAETVALADRIRSGACPPPAVRQGRRNDDAPPPEASAARREDTASPIAASATAGVDIADPAVAAAQSDAAPTPARRLRWSFAWGAAALCAVAASLIVLASRAPSARLPGLLVSGFHNVSGLPAEDGAVAGFDDLISSSLVTRQHLRLIEDQDADPQQTALSGDSIRQIGVRYLLQGSAAFETSGLHVTARLTDVRRGTELWSDHYDKAVLEAPEIAEDIAARAARAVSQDRDVVVGAAVPVYHGGPHAARELVALGHQIDFLDPADAGATQTIYRLAVQYDKDDVDALSHLANSSIRSATAGWPVDHAALAAADAILQRAMQLDPTNAFTLFNGCVLRRVQHRLPEAVELCKRTLDVDPRYPGALRELGHDQLESGDAAQAITSYQASIDAAPYVPYVYNSLKGLGVASLALGRRDDAIAYFRRSADLDIWNADNALLWLAAALEMEGRHAEAAKPLQEFVSRHPGLRIDDEYLGLLRAPAYADCRRAVLAALAAAGYPK